MVRNSFIAALFTGAVCLVAYIALRQGEVKELQALELQLEEF